MSFRVRFTEDAREDLGRIYERLLERDAGDGTGEHALQSVRDAITVLELAPLSCRKLMACDPFLRELIVGSVATGCALSFEIEDQKTIIVLAARRLHEDDYY